MGVKQKAKILALAQHDISCATPARSMKTAIEAILVINQQLIAVVGGQAAQALQGQKNPHYGEILKAKVALNKVFPLYQAGITDFEAFVKKKGDRWAFKGTLDGAKTALAHHKDQLKDYKDLVAASVNVI